MSTIQRAARASDVVRETVKRMLRFNWNVFWTAMNSPNPMLSGSVKLCTVESMPCVYSQEVSSQTIAAIAIEL